MLVGVTGGIGSGKSALTRLFADWGAAVVDADRVVHRVLDQPLVIDRLRTAFGDEILGAEGRVDRAALGTRAFADQASWDRLHWIVRRPVEELLWRETEQALAGTRGIVVVEAPLLFEWDLEDRFDVVLAVLAAEAERVARVSRRNGMDEGSIRRRLAFQLTDEERRRRADLVIENHGDLAALETQARRIWIALSAPDGPWTHRDRRGSPHR